MEFESTCAQYVIFSYFFKSLLHHFVGTMHAMLIHAYHDVSYYATIIFVVDPLHRSSLHLSWQYHSTPKILFVV